MAQPLANKPAENKAKRVYIRVPVNLPGTVIISEEAYKPVKIEEISTSGISFRINKSVRLPEWFKLEFRLHPKDNPIKVKGEIKNRREAGEDIRIGCGFMSISEEDAALLTKYVLQFVNISLPFKLAAIAGMACFIDALSRIAGYLLYLQGLGFDKAGQEQGYFRPYLIVLGIYAALGAMAFLFSLNKSDAKDKSRFLITLACLGSALVFLTIRGFVFLGFFLKHPVNLPASLFLFSSAVFYLYLAATIAFGVFSLKKIHLALEILDQHREALGTDESSLAGGSSA